MDNEEKLRNYVNKKYGEENYDRFLQGLKPFIEALPEGVPWKVDMPMIEPDDLIHYKVSVENPVPTISMTKFQSVIDERFIKLKENHSVRKAFSILEGQLINEGKDPEKYNLNDNPYAFNRAVNQRIAREYKKNKK